MCRIPSWLMHPEEPSRPTPASSCRLAHTLSANRDHFPPPRHPDPDWTWCTPGIDLAWLGLAALTWFGPKLLAWPRHPAPRPPSAPTGGGGGLPFLLLHSLLPILPSTSSPLPPCRQGLCQGQATQCHPGEAHGQQLREKGPSRAQCVRFSSCIREREERKVQPPYLAANASSAPPHAQASTPKCWTTAQCCITTEEAIISKE